MRICILGRAPYALLRRRAEVYAERGHDVHVVSLEAGEIDGVTVHTVASAGPGPARFVSAMPGVLRAVRRIAPDVVDLHGVITYGLFGLLPLGAPTVATIYGPDIYDAPSRSRLAAALVGRVLRAADLVFGSTPAIDAYLREGLGLDVSGKLAVSPWGIPLDRVRRRGAERRAEVRRALGVPDGAPVLIHARHIIDLWRPEVIVGAMPAVVREHPDAQLWFVYPEPSARGRELLAELRATVAAHGLEANVRFLGGMPYDDFLSHLHGSDAFVCVGTHDLLASTLLEAMAAGAVPVLADLPAYHEAVEQDASAFFVDPVTPERLAAVLTDVLADLPATRARVAEANGRTVEDRYDEVVCTDWMLERYAELARA